MKTMASVGSEQIAVALVGNPNTGKTTLFNALSGLRHRVGNYPGVTVETKKGRMIYGGEAVELIDLPGTYSLAPRSPDEMVAVDVLLGRQAGEKRPDLAVVIIDASNLERNLFLVTQVLELGLPVIVALNMTDVAKAQGVQIDVDELSKQMGIPIIPIQANRRIGLDKLEQTILSTGHNHKEAEISHVETPAPKHTPFPDLFEDEVHHFQKLIGDEVPTYMVRRLLLDVGGYTEQRLLQQNGKDLQDQLADARQRLAQGGCPVPAVEARSRYSWIRQICAGCVQRPQQRVTTWTDWLDHILIHRVWGTLIFFGLMFIVFQSIFTLAGPLMDWIDAGKDGISGAVRAVLPPGPLSSLLVDGVINGVGAVVIFLPQIMILFFFIALLEYCGYMARAAFLMDKLMSKCGLSGKSFIPMLSSVACAVPGIMAARVLENPRDRLATIVVAPLMSCSARLPVYVLLIGAFFTTGFAWWVPGVIMFAMYLLGIIIAPLVAWTLKRTLLRGETPVFVMEMPTYKWPSLFLVLRRAADAGWIFVRRAGTIILASMIVVWALLYFPYTDAQGRSYEQRVEAETNAARANKLTQEWKKQSYLGQLGQALEPVFRPLGWDWRIGVATLAAFPAREVVVGALGIVFEQGEVDPGDIQEAEDVGQTDLGRALHQARWQDDSEGKLFTLPTALSLMVFIALCCQCASTLAVIKRETGTWRWPVFTFVYMTVLAYIAAFLVYQVGTLLAA